MPQRLKLKGLETEVTKLYRGGKSQDEIGRIFGVSSDSVRRYLKRINITCRKSGRRDGEGLLSHCKHGHPMLSDNIYIYPSTGKRCCKTCKLSYSKQDLRKSMRLRNWKRKKRLRDPKWVTNQHLMYNYGITLEMRNQMIEQQGGRCALCGKSTNKLHVDHNHKTKIVRKLLCHNCNVGLGHFQEDVLLLEKAIEYLRRYNALTIGCAQEGKSDWVCTNNSAAGIATCTGNARPNQQF